jgi:hypothetical protein
MTIRPGVRTDFSLFFHGGSLGAAQKGPEVIVSFFGEQKKELCVFFCPGREKDKGRSKGAEN